jgi:hypothetical protein
MPSVRADMVLRALPRRGVCLRLPSDVAVAAPVGLRTAAALLAAHGAAVGARGSLSGFARLSVAIFCLAVYSAQH